MFEHLLIEAGHKKGSSPYVTPCRLPSTYPSELSDLENQILTIAIKAGREGVDLRQAISTAKRLNSSFSWNGPLESAEFRDLTKFTFSLLRQVFIPAGYVVNVARVGEGFELQRASIDSSSWTEFPYLESSSVWAASMSLTKGADLHAGFTLLDMAFVDRTQTAISAKHLVGTFGYPLPIPSLKALQRETPKLKLNSEKWVKGVCLPLMFWEEVQHARDLVFSAKAWQEELLDLMPVTVPHAITRPGSHTALALSSADEITVANIIELSGRLGACIITMQRLFALQEKELALISGIVFLANSALSGTMERNLAGATAGERKLSIVTYQNVEALLFGALQREFGLTEEKLLAKIFASPSVAGRTLLETLTALYRSQFFVTPERQDMVARNRFPHIEAFRASELL